MAYPQEERLTGKLSHPQARSQRALAVSRTYNAPLSRANEMEFSVNLSVRYVNALRQLPQYHCNIDSSGPLPQALTGVHVSPKGDLHDEDDNACILGVEFPGGHKIGVNALVFFQIALKKAAEIEISTAPGDFGIREGKQTSAQLRIAQLGEHLRREHSLDE
jgi:hypothetical protein